MLSITVSCLLLGALVGLILAFTGAGGGILAVPLLVFGLHLSVNQAAPIALLAVGVAAAIGAGLGLKSGKVRYKAASLIALSGLIVAPIGVWASHKIHNTPLTLIFAAVLAFVAINILRKTIIGQSERAVAECDSLPCQIDSSAGKFIWTLPCARFLALSGLLTGFLSGLIGVGGGFVIVPALKKASNLTMDQVIPTSLGVIALVSLSGVLAAAFHNTINWTIALPFSLGAIIAMLSGRVIAKHVQGSRLMQTFAVFSLMTAIFMVVKVFAG